MDAPDASNNDSDASEASSKVLEVYQASGHGAMHLRHLKMLGCIHRKRETTTSSHSPGCRHREGAPFSSSPDTSSQDRVSEAEAVLPHDLGNHLRRGRAALGTLDHVLDLLHHVLM